MAAAALVGLFLLGWVGTASALTQTMTCASTAGSGANWVTPDNILANDGTNYASYNGAARQFLNVTTCSPTIPSGATVTGIQVHLLGCGASGTAGARQFDVNLLGLGTCTEVTGIAQAQCATWTDQNIPVSTADTWGCTALSTANVNSSSFGFTIRDTNTSAAELRYQYGELIVTYNTIPTTTTTTTTTTVSTSSTTSTTLFPWAQNIAGGLLVSFDVVDSDTGTATDLLSLATIEVPGDDTKVRATECVDNSGRCRNSNNGGDSSSRFAGWVNLAANERGGWSKNAAQAFNGATGTQCVALHQPASGGVTADRTIMRWMEADGSPGCSVTLKADDSLVLTYGGTTIGTASVGIPTTACTDNPYRGCTTGTDCTGGSCAGGTVGGAAGTCDTTTGGTMGRYCYWPTLCLSQDSLIQATRQVKCSLAVNGMLEAGGAYQNEPTTDLLTSFEFGGVGPNESGTAQLAFDDFGMSSSLTDTHLFYLHWYYPLTAVNNGGVEDTCGLDGTPFARCVNDYGSATLNDYRLATTPLDDSIRLNPGKTVDFTEWTPKLTSISGSATIPIIAVNVVARTNSTAGTYTMTGRVGICPTPAASCAPLASPLSLSLGPDTNVLWRFVVRQTGPPAGGIWSVDTLKTWGFQFGNQASSPTSIRLNALGAVAKVDLATTEPPVQNLKDHNLGLNDGQVVWVFTGDSTYLGTGSSVCNGGSNAGQQCSQASYCSGDANKSKPPGGCSGDAECQTCTGRRLNFGTYGYPCGSLNGGASCNLGTCTAGVCSGDDTVTCSTTQPQCVGAGNPTSCCTGPGTGNCDCDLGTCASETCTAACPGGVCPNRAGAPNLATVNADLVLNCSQDGGTIQTSRDILAGALYGRSDRCFRASGTVTGRCTCTSNLECQQSGSGACTFAVGTCNTGTGRCTGDATRLCATDVECRLGRCTGNLGVQCSTDAHCGGAVGSCVGQCTASDNGREACTGQLIPGGSPSQPQCASVHDCTGLNTPYTGCTGVDTGTVTPQVCSFPPLDYAADGAGLNDLALSRTEDAECRDPFVETTTLDGQCDNCVQAACSTHAECTGAPHSVAPDAQCFGKLPDGTGGCLRAGGCTTHTARCGLQALTCAFVSSGLTCTGYTGGVINDGWCTCTTSANCPAGYLCNTDSICTKSCTVGTVLADCGTNGTCVGGLCQGRCTCPCDAVSCTKDEDCPRKVMNRGFGAAYVPTYTLTGVCSGGKCSQCGQTACASHPAQHAYQNNYFKQVLPWIIAKQRQSAADVKAAADAATAQGLAADGDPLFLPISFPTGRSNSYLPLGCRGGDHMGAGVLSGRVALQYASEWKHSIDVRPAVENLPDSDVYADIIHPNTNPGGTAWAEGMTNYAASLNSCRTGTGPASLIQRYCRSPNGTWQTTLCTTDTDCSGSELCMQRLCSVDDETNTNNGGCPGTPTCNVE